MKFYFLVLNICSFGGCALGQLYHNLLITRTDETIVNMATLHAQDNKRCLLFNIISAGHTDQEDLLNLKISTLVVVKVFYDSSEENVLQEIIPKTELDKYDLIPVKSFINKFSPRLKNQLETVFLDRDTSYSGTYPWQGLLSADYIIYENEGVYYKISGRISYINIYQLSDFTQQHILQSNMNLINTRSKIARHIPVNYSIGRIFLIGIEGDSTYYFFKKPPTIDDNDWDGRKDEFRYRPGTGIIAFSSFVPPIFPQKKYDINSIPPLPPYKLWEYDKYYHFIPSITHY